MNFEKKYYKYKQKYIALKEQSEYSVNQNTLNSNLNNILGGEESASPSPSPTPAPTKLTPIFTEDVKPEPTPTPTPAPEVIPDHGKIEWVIDPEQPRNLRNNHVVKLTKKDGESFILRVGDCINYVSKSGFDKDGNLIPLDENKALQRLPRQVGRQLGQIVSFLDIDGTHVGKPTAIEVYRQNYDTHEFGDLIQTKFGLIRDTHKTKRFDHVNLYKQRESWIPGAGP